MANKRLLAIIIIFIFVISLITAVPITFLFVVLSSYSKIHENRVLKYSASNSSPIIELNVNNEIGNVEINYIYPPINYYVKVEVSIEMFGKNIAGKSCSDYFDISWKNDSSPVNFNMKVKSDVDQIGLLSLIKDATVTISLRADIIFDINTNVIYGNVEINAPFGVSINEVKINNTYGDILYDFNHCTIEGNITGINNEGDINFKTYNVEYSQDCSFFLDTETGNITVDIYQYNQMGANVSGIIKNAGVINLIYEDNSANIGALFLLYNTSQFWTFWDKWEGFPEDPGIMKGGNGYFFQSFDFPTKNNYNLSFYKKHWLGRYYVNLISVPFS